eukprot:755348-Hanusia_phi.AAC.4
MAQTRRFLVAMAALSALAGDMLVLSEEPKATMAGGGGGGGVLVLEAQIPTLGNAGWEAFEMDGRTFMAAANFWDGESVDMSARSKIYRVRLNETHRLSFRRLQSMHTRGAHSWDFFEAGWQYVHGSELSKGDSRISASVSRLSSTSGRGRSSKKLCGLQRKVVFNVVRPVVSLPIRSWSDGSLPLEELYILSRRRELCSAGGPTAHDLCGCCNLPDVPAPDLDLQGGRRRRRGAKGEEISGLLLESCDRRPDRRSQTLPCAGAGSVATIVLNST